MRTDFNTDMDHMIRKHFSQELESLDLPPLSAASRKKVFTRKTKNKPVLSFFMQTWDLMRRPLRVYHLGLTLLVISFGVFYLNDNAYDQVGNSSFIEGASGLAITNTTISVNSSTMLTSIPTLVIRN